MIANTHTSPQHTIDIIIDRTDLVEDDDADSIRNILTSTLHHVAPQEWLHSELSVTLTDDAHIQPLNATYRGKDAPTNILSFAPELPPKANSDGYIHLGDLVISLETLKKESLELNRKYDYHFIHLLIHGLLHLLGYDHEDEQSALIMEEKEEELLAMHHIPSPYKGLP